MTIPKARRAAFLAQFNDPLYSVGGKMATARQFLDWHRRPFAAVFPAQMEGEDYLELAEDYADYVCAWEKSGLFVAFHFGDGVGEPRLHAGFQAVGDGLHLRGERGFEFIEA